MTTQEMNKPVPKLDILGSPKFTFVLRLLLGTTFVVFGASKLFDLTGFADTVVDYRVLPEALARAYGLALPAVEVIVGISLILGLFLRIAAVAAILIIASLIAGTTGNLYWSGTTVKTCGCLQGLDWQLGTGHLVAQFFMLIMAAQILLHKGEFLSLDSRIFKRTSIG